MNLYILMILPCFFLLELLKRKEFKGEILKRFENKRFFLKSEKLSLSILFV